MIRLLTSSAIILGLTSFFYSCKNNDNLNNSGSILGRWEVFSSEINNKQSKNMENAFFHFKEDGMVESNIFEENSNYSYKLSGQKLSINSPEPINFDIKNLEADTLVMEGVIKVFFMKFYLAKKQAQ